MFLSFLCFRLCLFPFFVVSLLLLDLLQSLFSSFFTFLICFIFLLSNKINSLFLSLIQLLLNPSLFLFLFKQILILGKKSELTFGVTLKTRERFFNFFFFCFQRALVWFQRTLLSFFHPNDFKKKRRKKTI